MEQLTVFLNKLEHSKMFYKVNKTNKVNIIFLFYFISLIIWIISLLIVTLIGESFSGLIEGIVLMLIAIPIHIFGKKFKVLYIFSSLLNFIGCGFSISGYYLLKGISVNFLELLCAALPSVFIISLVYIMLQKFSASKKVTLFIATIINFTLLVFAVVYWIKTGESFFSFGFFCLFASLFYLYLFGISINHDERYILKDVSYISFGAFIIISIVVIAILSEGDALELLDFDVGGEGKKKK